MKVLLEGVPSMFGCDSAMAGRLGECGLPTKEGRPQTSQRRMHLSLSWASSHPISGKDKNKRLATLVVAPANAEGYIQWAALLGHPFNPAIPRSNWWVAGWDAHLTASKLVARDWILGMHELAGLEGSTLFEPGVRGGVRLPHSYDKEL